MLYRMQLSFLIAALVLACQTARAQDADPPLAGDCAPHWEGKGVRCRHADAEIARYRLYGPLLETENAPDPTDVTHCHLEIEIDPVAKTLVGSNTLEVIARSGGLTQFRLDLQTNMVVDAVTVNGATAGFTRPTDQILITLDRAYNPGETFQASVTYHGTPLDLSFGFFNFGTHAGTAVASSMSEPWYAKLWWPCKQSLTDKFTADVWVTTPDWMTVASNGALRGTDDLPASRRRYRWEERHPIDFYLVAVTATNYTKLTASYNYPGGSMPVECYIYPEQANTYRSLPSTLVSMIGVFSQPNIYGQYPFVDEKYGLVQFNWGGGMENQTITSQGTFDDWITAHELSHQWWGDMVTCKTWHDIWLNEGFATFSEAVWDEHRPGGGASAYHSNFPAGTTYSDGTVYRYDVSSVASIFSTYSYQKGAWVLHMLRHVLGEATFFETLAAYRAAFAGSTASTEDFRAIAESVSGRDLSWFFNQWVYQPGAPSYRYGYKRVQIDTQYWLQLCIEQVQTAWPPFTMPVDIKLTDPTGSRTFPVWNKAPRQWYLLPAGASLNTVVLDSDAWILRSAPTSTTYLDGPPKLIRVTPSPGERFDTLTSLTTIQLQFSEPVNCAVTDFAVIGSRSGPQSFAMAYSSSNHTVTLTFPQPLANGQTWTVSVAETVRSVAANAALDGELASADNSTVLPSGDGLPGGNSVFGFFVAAPGDFDHDGDIDVGDLGVLQACLSGPTVAYAGDCLGADFDRDGDVDLADYGVFQRCYSGAGQPVSAGCGN